MDHNIYKTPASDLGEQPESSLLSKKKRIFIVILCYLLSSIGLLTLVSWLISAMINFDGSLLTILPFVIIVPMWMHIKMSRAWIEDLRLGKKIPIIGTALSLTPLSILAAEDLLSTGYSHAITVVVGSGVFAMLFFSPMILLAIYLCIFHSSKNSIKTNNLRSIMDSQRNNHEAYTGK